MDVAWPQAGREGRLDANMSLLCPGARTPRPSSPAQARADLEFGKPVDEARDVFALKNGAMLWTQHVQVERTGAFTPVEHGGARAHPAAVKDRCMADVPKSST